MLPRDVSSVGTSNSGRLRRPQVQGRLQSNRSYKPATTKMDRVQVTMNTNNDPSSKTKSSSAENFNFNYGSKGVTPTQRPTYSYSHSHSHSHSHSRSVERLQRVLEDANDEDDEGTPPAWAISNDVEGANRTGSTGPDHIDSDELDEQPDYYYQRACRIYALVPVTTFLLFVLFALLPLIINHNSLPHYPPLKDLLKAALLAASLWCLSHALRVPSFSLVSAALQAFTKVAFSRRRGLQNSQVLVTLTTTLHTILFAFVQESLRIASFSILGLHWFSSLDRDSAYNHSTEGSEVHSLIPSSNAIFRVVWALSLGWAIAEACAGIVQGYEQLALYADADPAEYLSLPLSHSALASRRASFQSQLSGPNAYVDIDEEELGEESGGERPGRERALGLVRRSVWLADEDGNEGGKSMNRAHATSALNLDVDMGIDEAFERLANVKAREDLEELYGEPYITIPVFVPILERLDSILLSLGLTLILAAAYLPPLPTGSTTTLDNNNFSIPSISSSMMIHNRIPQTHHTTFPLRLFPTLMLLAIIHALLALLHSPTVLPRVGLPAAAYTSCIVGLALAFGGVGVWTGVW